MARLLFLFPLSSRPPVSVNTFDYVSSIISYSLIGIAIFSGKYDNLSTSKLSATISEVTMIPRKQFKISLWFLEATWMGLISCPHLLVFVSSLEHLPHLRMPSFLCTCSTTSPLLLTRQRASATLQDTPTGKYMQASPTEIVALTWSSIQFWVGVTSSFQNWRTHGGTGELNEERERRWKGARGRWW